METIEILEKCLGVDKSCKECGLLGTEECEEYCKVMKQITLNLRVDKAQLNIALDLLNGHCWACKRWKVFKDSSFQKGCEYLPAIADAENWKCEYWELKE